MASEGKGGESKGEPTRVKPARPAPRKRNLIEGPPLVPYDDETLAVNWERALEQCGNDESFLLELLRDLFFDGINSIQKTLQLANDYLEKVTKGEELSYAELRKFQEELRKPTHAIKGAAATLMVPPLSHAALVCERTLKDNCQKYDHQEEETKEANETISAAMDDVVVGVDTPVRRLVNQFEGFATYVTSLDIDALVDKGAELPPRYEEISLSYFKESVRAHLQTFEAYEAMYA